ncbi:hypothetical protein LCGC14_2726370 [marine sediment metagenome]|uniref:Uncharacterized protein n=1 Tax=marine sediment metagenome TaxID=412755 RepID=A0A0F9C0B0_9ZZZZ
MRINKDTEVGEAFKVLKEVTPKKYVSRTTFITIAMLLGLCFSRVIR